MLDAHFSFETTAFDDPETVRAQSVNGITGHALAAWLGSELTRAGCTVSGPWVEDHGWDLSIEKDAARYVCSCSIATEPPGLPEGHVALSKHRSTWDRIAGRNRFRPDDEVARTIARILAGSPAVARLKSET